MRVLIAPDAFADSLTAGQAAEAIAEGWRRQAPQDELDLCPMSNGGAGFVDVLHAALGGEVLATAVPGPLPADAPGDDIVPATILQVGKTAFVESSQVCAPAFTGRHYANEATSYGVGVLAAWAADVGVDEIVIGLGASGAADGGAGVLAALGARSQRPLDEGVGQLEDIAEIDLSACAATLKGARLLAVGESEATLSGLFGVAKTEGEGAGFPEQQLPWVDRVLEGFGALVDRKAALMPGSGAAGGIGFAVLALGGEYRSGLDYLVETVRLPERAAQADLVITGEASFDFASRSGTVPYRVAEVAGAALRPCIVLADRVDVGAREMRALGIESAYAIADQKAAPSAVGDPAEALAALAMRVARTWSRE